MAYKVIFDRRAVSDLNDIFDYLVQRSPGGAKNVIDDIRSAISILEEWPRIGVEMQKRSTRMRISPKYRYRILYEVDEDHVRIRQIVHGNRNTPTRR